MKRLGEQVKTMKRNYLDRWYMTIRYISRMFGTALFKYAVRRNRGQGWFDEATTAWASIMVADLVVDEERFDLWEATFYASLNGVCWLEQLLMDLKSPPPWRPTAVIHRPDLAPDSPDLLEGL